MLWSDFAKWILSDKEKGLYRQEGFNNFKSWIKHKIEMNPNYILGLLKLEKEFGGSQLEKLPLSRVLYIYRKLSSSFRDELKKNRSLIENLSAMNRKDFCLAIMKLSGEKEKRDKFEKVIGTLYRLGCSATVREIQRAGRYWGKRGVELKETLLLMENKGFVCLRTLRLRGPVSRTATLTDEGINAMKALETVNADIPK